MRSKIDHEMQWRAEHSSLNWHRYSTRHSVCWWLYDDRDRIIRAFCRYGRNADFRVLTPLNVWMVANSVRGLDKYELPAIDLVLGLKPGTSKLLVEGAAEWRISVGPHDPPKRNHAGRSWNQWTEGKTGPKYDDPNFDYRAHFEFIKQTAPEYIWRDLWDFIRERRNNIKVWGAAFSWDRVYPPEDCILIPQHFVECKQHYDYMDNERVPLVTSRQHMKRYRKAKESGCCGSYDTVLKINGKLYAVGFNYGH